MRAPASVGWAKNASSRFSATSFAKFDRPMIIGCTITVSMPAFFAAAICARSASRSPVRLGT